MARTGWLRPGMVAAGMALALAAALLATLATPPVDAASRYKVVTRTLTNEQPIAIPEIGTAAPYPSEISAGGFKRGKILDVNVTLKNLTHPFPDDLDVMVSHGDANRTVMSDVGSGALDTRNVTLKLDDEAAARIGAALPSGSFKPTDDDEGGVDDFLAPAPAESGMTALSGFDGSNPNGPWQLWVYDDFGGAGGQFGGGWSVTIKARVLR